MAVLKLKAARGWSQVQTAKAMLVTPATVASWNQRIDEQGPNALVQLSEPVNRFPDFVRHLVRRLKVLCPMLGKAGIARTLARAGLHLAATTVGRMLKEDDTTGGTGGSPASASMPSRGGSPGPPRVITAKYPNHVWHVDLTTVSAVGGFWACPERP